MTTYDAEPCQEPGRVRAGWELVDLVEQLGDGPSRRLLAPRWETERDRGASGYAPLKYGDLTSVEEAAMYESPNNLARFRRTLDFALPGDSVVEVGIGRGYLGTRLLRDGGATSYLGLDLFEENAAATRQTLAANGYAAAGTADVGDLYELTRAEVAAVDAGLLVCCEVLEHVPDPERALEVLADALPEGTELLITTPLLGRMETIWEHVALFGVLRLRRMVELAGLTVHHVEPLANQWVLLLASRGPGPSARAARATSLGAPEIRPLEPADRATTITNVPIDKVDALPSRWNKRATATIGRLGVYDPGRPESIVLRMRAEPLASLPDPGTDGDTDNGGRYAGLALAANYKLGVRLELELVDVEDGVHDLYVDFYDGPTRVGRWKWDLADRPKKAVPTFTLRPGLKGHYLRPVNLGDLRRADRVEIFARLEPGASAELRLHRLAWIG